MDWQSETFGVASSIGNFISNALRSANGGTWSSGGARYFDTQDETFAAGSYYNDRNNSWGNTQYGGSSASTLAYIWTKTTGSMPTQETIQYHASRGITASVGAGALPSLVSSPVIQSIYSIVQSLATVGSIALLGTIAVSDTETQKHHLSLGTLAPSGKAPFGHSMVGIGIGGITTYYHYTGTKKGRFERVGELELRSYKANGMIFDYKSITDDQMARAIPAILLKLGLGPSDYNIFTNNCATNAADIIRAAGFDIGCGAITPETLRQSFIIK